MHCVFFWKKNPNEMWNEFVGKQVSNLETPHREISDIYDTAEDEGLSQDCIQRLPEYHFKSSEMAKITDDGLCCPICLQVNFSLKTAIIP